MAPSKKPKLSPPATSLQSSSSSTSFIPAVTTIAVAQICRSRGYSAAEPSALRCLSAIAALYIETLARSSSAIANSKSRTQSNLLDLIRAIEDLTLTHRGFAGGSDPTRPLLRSSILKELRDFVRSVREIPFAKPILKEGSDSRVRVSRSSFAEMGVEPPNPHVPKWLPFFPPLEGEERRERGDERRRWEEKGGIFEVEKEIEENEDGNSNSNKLVRKNNGVLLSTVERKNVRFELVGKNRIFILKKKRKLIFKDEED